MDKKEPKYIEEGGRFLLESGLLFAINRTILHPLGLAMFVNVNDNGKVSIAQKLWDDREDPEGIIYGPDLLRDGYEKYRKFLEQYGHAKFASRNERLGYVIQPLPGNEGVEQVKIDDKGVNQNEQGKSQTAGSN